MRKRANLKPLSNIVSFITLGLTLWWYDWRLFVILSLFTWSNNMYFDLWAANKPKPSKDKS